MARAAGRGGVKQMPWLVALPAVLLLVAFNYIGAFAGALYAFTDWNGISASAEFIGLENFRRILAEPTTRGALVHTLLLAALFVV
ncbi:MAG: sugar ABC transporter permease, partial [Gemmatimonadota bacterium]|nr:sugar ABC transporter permease [Gemmatimonadota bacterium]